MQRKVVVGVDGSEEALRAVRWAAVEARRWGLPLRLVNAAGWVVDTEIEQAAYGSLHDALVSRAQPGWRRRQPRRMPSSRISSSSSRSPRVIRSRCWQGSPGWLGSW